MSSLLKMHGPKNRILLKISNLNCLLTAGVRVFCVCSLFEIYVQQCGRFSRNALVSPAIIIAPILYTHFKKNDSLVTMKNLNSGNLNQRANALSDVLL